MTAIHSQLSVSRVLRILTLALVIVALIICLTPQIEVKADTLSVWKTADDGSEGTLRWAVNNAFSGDTISFNTSQIPPGSTIVIAEQIFIDKNLTITGPGAGYLTISGDNQNRVFEIEDGSEVRISGLRISDGASWMGGGIRNKGDLYLEYCIIESNLTTGDGGGIYNDRHLEIDHSTIRNNRTEDNEWWAGGGAGIYNLQGATAHIRYSTISDNTCGDHIGDGVGWGGDGGGIYGLTQASIYLTNCTISGNSAGNSSSPQGGAGRGGGIYITGGVRLSNCTIVNNQAGSGGGIWKLGILEARNSIIANNNASNSPNIYGDLWSKGCNLIGDEFSGWHYDTGSITEGDQLGVDPMLGVLADNGGFTQTHALLSGSPAIDGVLEGRCYTAGWYPEPVTDDQRDISRPKDGDGDGLALCDIGAYEYTPPPIMYINLAAVWNTFSTPIALHTCCDTWDELLELSGLTDDVMQIYYYDGATQHWGPVFTGHHDEVKPLEGFFVQLDPESPGGLVPIIPHPESLVPPSKQVYTGANLVGPAPASLADETVVFNLVSIYEAEGGLCGYTMVISPPVNADGWDVYMRDDPDSPLMRIGNSYWVIMDNSDVLWGSSTTPLIP